MKIEDIISQYRKDHDLSQRQFAALCKLSPTYIWYIEQGKNPQTGKRVNPSLPAIYKIARAMGMSAEELMAKCDNMLVALTDEDDQLNVFTQLFAQLTSAQKEAVLAIMKAYVEP